MRDAFIARLLELAKRDPKILLVTGDLGFAVFDQYIKTVPSQFLNAGVAEQNMTGLAAGLALEGRTVFTYSIANFSTLRCLEQVRNDACYHSLNVNIVSIGGGFSYGPLGFSHHATEDLAIMRSLPGMTVFSPGDDWETQEATEAATRTPGTTYLRIDRASAGNTSRPGEVFEPGKGRVLREGADVTLVSTGGILAETLKAAEALAGEGIQARVVSLHTLAPLDTELLLRSAKETRGILTIEEHTIVGGLGGAVAEILLEGGARPGFFHRIGLRGGFATAVGSQDYLRKTYAMDASEIVRQVKRLVSR